MKIKWLVVLGILVAGFCWVFYISPATSPISTNDNQEQPALYQGPVPLGYDEDYFRQTGITKLLENDE